MLSVATCGWLMVQQERAAHEGGFGGGCRATPAFLNARIVVGAVLLLDHLVPEAMGQRASAMAGAALLYQLDAEAYESLGLNLSLPTNRSRALALPSWRHFAPRSASPRPTGMAVRIVAKWRRNADL